MYYAEIDETGYCFHVTDAELPLGDTILKVDSMDVLGKVWDGEKWNDPEPVVPVTDEYQQYYNEVNAALLGGE